MSTAATTNPKPRPRRGTPRPGAPTTLQKKAVKLFEDQLRTGGTRSIREILEEAGYSKDVAKQQSHTMAGIRPLLQPIIDRMEKHREKVMERMEKTVGKASYGDLTTSLDKLTKNVQLLSGRSTGILELSDEDRERIDDLIDG